jgi:hypothetical protein
VSAQKQKNPSILVQRLSEIESRLTRMSYQLAAIDAPAQTDFYLLVLVFALGITLGRVIESAYLSEGKKK